MDDSSTALFEPKLLRGNSYLANKWNSIQKHLKDDYWKTGNQLMFAQLCISDIMWETYCRMGIPSSLMVRVEGWRLRDPFEWEIGDMYM